MIFDSHAHLNDEAYGEKLDLLIKEIEEEGITHIVNPSVDMESSKSAIELSKKYDIVYAAIGYHPSDIDKFVDSDISKLEEMTKIDKVVAIGEIGLDYHYDGFDKKKQQEVFIKHIELANRLNFPIIIHTRDAVQDTFDIIKEYKHPETPCVLHCFSQSLEMAKSYLDLGCKISFAGPVTFKNAKGLLDVAKYVLIDEMFIETDSPYLTPHPYRGKKNSPKYVKLVGNKIAELKGLSQEEVFEQTAKNAMEFFRIK